MLNVNPTGFSGGLDVRYEREKSVTRGFSFKWLEE